MSKTKNDKAVAVQNGTDKILAKLSDVEIKPEEYQGYDDSGKLYIPFVSIRQKALKDSKGKTIKEAGAFKITDPVEDEERSDVKNLKGTIIAWRIGRVYFESLESKQPECKSPDGITGSTYGDCSTCEYNQWHSEKSRPGGAPACSEIRNLCFVDQSLGAFILTLGRSGIKPFDLYDERLKRRKPRPPHHFLLIEIGLEYQTEPAEHYTPKFKLLDVLPVEQRAEIKEQRKKIIEMFKTSVEKMEHRPDDYLGEDDKQKIRELAEEARPEDEEDLPF